MLANGLGEADRAFYDPQVPESEIVHFTPHRWLGKRWSNSGSGGLGKSPFIMILARENARRVGKQFSKFLYSVRGRLP